MYKKAKELRKKQELEDAKNQAQPRAEVEDLTVDQTLTSQASHLITVGPDSSPHWNQMII